jgi:threonyl-tRNA synthetase
MSKFNYINPIMTKTKHSKIDILRHSCAHVMAAAVLEMFPKAKFGIGPTIEDGFYYDFGLSRTLTPEDLPRIEEQMKKIIKVNHPFEKREINIKKAKELFKKAKQTYKVELIEDLEKERVKRVSVYKSGKFVDLCRGPHLDSTGKINPSSFKLTHIAGAYWKGDEKRPMLQRIYGVAFQNPKELRQHLAMLKEAKKRDHRKLGQELDLFSFARGSTGLPGSVYWHPKGTIIYQETVDYIRKRLRELKYGEIKAPMILNRKIWVDSGHWDKYKDNMYFAATLSELKKLREKRKGKYRDPFWGIKPMNCPGMIAGIYNSKKRSYREFPLRFSEFGTVHRYEEKGVIHGLFRARVFTQDDAHVFCIENQLNYEIKTIIDLILSTYKDFGFGKVNIELSTRPKNYIGGIKDWNKAEKILEASLKDKKLDFKINKGEGAFYGPKIDFHVEDALNRSWQLGTIQLDFSMPKNLNAKFTDEDGKEKTPIMLHRAVLGSLERFIGILIEHYAGAFPLWLSPVQVNIIPVSDKFIEQAEEINQKLISANIRTQFDDRTESVGKKISDSIRQKIPYAIVVGEEEIKSKKLPVRARGKKKIIKMEIEKFIGKVKEEIEKKKQQPQ